MQLPQENFRIQKKEKLDSKPLDQLKENKKLAENAARIFAYFRQFRNSRIINPKSEREVGYKKYLEKYREPLTKIAILSEKHGMDLRSYMDFFVREIYKNDDSLDTLLINKNSLQQYITHIEIQKKYDNIYKWFMKSVKNIAVDCFSQGIHSSKEYFKYIIQKKILGNLVMSGHISIYFLAAIPRFNKLIDKFDYFTKLELEPLKNCYDVYNNDINIAYRKFKNINVNPLKITDKLIEKMFEQKK